MLYYKSEWYACCSLRLNILYKERLVLHFEEVKQNYVRRLLVLLSGREEKNIMNIPILQKKYK